MKNLLIFLSVFLSGVIFSSCRPIASQNSEAVAPTCARLLQIIQSKTQDTLALKPVLDSAFLVAQTASTRELDSLFALVSKTYGNILLLSKPFEARTIYERGKNIGRRQLSEDNDVIMRLYHNIAMTYYNVSDHKTALVYFDSVKITRFDSITQVFKITTLKNMADCYKNLNDKASAERIFIEIEPLAQQYYSKTKLAEFYIWYSITLKTLKKFAEALEKARKSLDITELNLHNPNVTNTDSMLFASCHFSMAYAFHDSGAYKLGERHYLIAMTMFQKLNDLDNVKKCLGNLGFLYRFDKRFNKAEATLTTGINLFEKTNLSNKDIRRKASFYVNRSEVYLETKQYPKAIADHDSAIYFFTQYDKNPTLTAVMLQARPVLLSVLTDKAKALAALAEKGVDTEGYQKALKLTDSIVALADDIRADYFSDAAKLTLANDIKPALEKAIILCQNLHKQTKNAQYLEKAFGFVEYSRSMVLYENARLTNQLPTELKAENEQLKTQEAALLSKNNVEELQKYLQHKRQFREKIKALNKNKLAAITDLKANLLPDDQTALIEYFVGDSSIFTFLLLKNDLKVFEIKKIKDFEDNITAFRREFTQHTPASDATNFSRQATALSAILLRGPLSQLSPTISKLIIAPDGVLAYVPFEILTPSKNVASDIANNGVISSRPVTANSTNFTTNFKETDFLLKHFAVSYAYSANLLLMQKQTKRHETTHLFASFVAKYEKENTQLMNDNPTSKVAPDAIAYRSALSRDGLLDLQGAKDEVRAISQVIGGKTFENSDATEGSFKREAPQYRVLHLAMHAYADDQDPMLSRLLFTINPQDTTEDGDLTVAELYAMHLNADLAVLSACNTGFGTLNKGEGVMSLARAFTYAGVPATVTSLWEAPDATTPAIMAAFYENLKSGLSKDEALREAKLTYLKNTRQSIEANPYLWASFVPMGNMDALNLAEKRPLSIWVSDFGFWISGGLGALMLVVFGFIWRRNLSST